MVHHLNNNQTKQIFYLHNPSDTSGSSHLYEKPLYTILSLSLFLNHLDLKIMILHYYSISHHSSFSRLQSLLIIPYNEWTLYFLSEIFVCMCQVLTTYFSSLPLLFDLDYMHRMEHHNSCSIVTIHVYTLIL